MAEMMPLPAGNQTWADHALSSIDPRERRILLARFSGSTLQEIGTQEGLTRERIRQLVLEAEKKLTSATDHAFPNWRQRLAPLLAAPAVPASAIAEALTTHNYILVSALAAAAGFKHARAWGSRVEGWWTTDLSVLDSTLHAIADEAPIRASEFEATAAALGAARFPVEKLFEHKRSPLIKDQGGNWLRRRILARDSAYLYLLKHGEPVQMEELITGVDHANIQALRESLRRDARFKQIHPEGTWALSEWTHLGESPYTNAVEALVDVLTEYGPISKDVLFSRVAQLYPVSSWRLEQCLLSEEIGMTADGMIDLVKRGAEPIEDSEPTKPETMACDEAGNIFGIRLTVDKDMIRGSGIGVHRWLTWKLGLRQAPMSKTFDIAESPKPITVRRGTSIAQISSLRKYIQEQGMVIGCEMILILRVDDLTARVVHACALDTCKATRIQ